MNGPTPRLDPADIAVRPMRTGERAYVIHSWSEGWKQSPAMRRKVWRDFKVLDIPRLDAALDRRDTTVLMATIADRSIGYIVFARWPSIDAIHWLYVRKVNRSHDHVVPTALLDAAALKSRIVYTHQGEVPGGARLRDDQRMAAWLRERGNVVSYVPYEEWAG